MKKPVRILISLVVIAFVLMTIPASAEVPTKLTFTQVEKAPTFDGIIDDVYGEKIFDLKATDLKVGENNLFPRSQAELDPLMDVYNVMQALGYAVHDKENLYLAFDIKDIAPKAASNSTEYWNSTNIQLIFYINQQLCFPTIAFAGTDKVNVIGDARSEMDVSKIRAKFKDNGNGNFIYEIVIPWVAVPDVKSLDDVDDVKFGFIQSSMAKGYICSAFGEPYDLKYNTLVPVTLKNLAKEENSSSVQKPNNSTSQGANDNTNSDNNSIITDGTQIGNEIKPESSSTVIDDTSTIVEETSTNGTNTTLVLVLIILAVLVIVGAGVAIIIINRKPKTKNDSE